MLESAYNLLNYFILLVIITSGQCKPVHETPMFLKSELFVTPRSISPGQVNLCDDFVHTIKDGITRNVGFHHRDLHFGPKEVIQDLLKENWKRNIGKELRKFTKRHVPCKVTQKRLKRQKVGDYIEIHHAQRANITSLMKLYEKASRLSLLLNIINTDGPKQCCLQDSRLVGLYRKFKNRMVANLYQTVLPEMKDWTVSECVMSAAIKPIQPMRCEDVVHVITVVLNDSIRTAKQLWKDMKRVEKEL